MSENKENQIKFDPGSPIGCGIALLVFSFAIVSLNWGFFTSMTDWSLKDGENLPFYHLYLWSFVAIYIHKYVVIDINMTLKNNSHNIFITYINI